MCCNYINSSNDSVEFENDSSKLKALCCEQKFARGWWQRDRNERKGKWDIGNKCAMKDISTGKETNHPVPNNDILCGAWESTHMFYMYRFVLEYPANLRVFARKYIYIYYTRTCINEFNLTFSKIHITFAIILRIIPGMFFQK